MPVKFFNLCHLQYYGYIHGYRRHAYSVDSYEVSRLFSRKSSQDSRQLDNRWFCRFSLVIRSYSGHLWSIDSAASSRFSAERWTFPQFLNLHTRNTILLIDLINRVSCHHILRHLTINCKWNWRWVIVFTKQIVMVINLYPTNEQLTQLNKWL